MNQVEIGKLALEIIPSLAANGLTWVFQKAAKPLAHREDITKEKIARIDSVSTLLQKASASVARALPSKPSINALKEFLVSPETDWILKQIYCAKLSTESTHGFFDDIRTQFKTHLSLHLNLNKNQADELADPLFEALLGACDQALHRAINASSLGALEAQNTLRHRLVIEDLSAIKRSLDIIKSTSSFGLEAISNFEAKLRIAIEQRHGFIIPPNLSTAKKVPIDDLYVASNFSRFTKEDTYRRSSLLYPSPRFWNLIERTVVLGSPGAGKSTFSQKLCFTLAKNYLARPMANRLLTPLLVVLRDYGAERKERRLSIIQFIESMITSRYQIEPPVGAIEYLLTNGHILIIFDGLDELLETAYRQEIASDVEIFSRLYLATPILVTSREVGYDQAPLDPRQFQVFRIAEFDQTQVATYVTKWFAIDEDLSSQEKRELPRSFLAESKSVSDLRANPLMLGLMCNIYRGESYIPKNRPSVYEKCALMLFEKWDRSRRINVPFTFEDKLSPVMKYLAHWIYSDVQLQKGVTESQLIERATQYLHNRHFEDIDVARKQARDFIEFCRGRAWIFTDTGSTAQEPLYQFTHRTFLEYFTAAHLVRIYPIPEKLAMTLIPKIQKREWDIVAQLAFQIQSNQVEGAVDVLCEIVLNLAESLEEGSQWAMASFLSRCLEFLSPSPRVLREISKLATLLSLKAAASQVKRFLTGPFSWELNSIELWVALASVDNRPIVGNAMRTTIAEAIEGQDSCLAIAAIDATFHLTFLPQLGGPEKSDEYLSKLRAEIIEGTADSMVGKASCGTLASLLMAKFGQVNADQLVEWHGINTLFHPFYSVAFRIGYSPIADQLLKPSVRLRQWAAINLERLGKMLATVTLPWLATRELGLFSRMRFPQQFRVPKVTENPDIFFAVFCLLGVLVESFENRRSISDVEGFIRKTKNHQIATVRELLLSRISDVTASSTTKIPGLSSKQLEIIDAWSSRRISFIGKRSTK